MTFVELPGGNIVNDSHIVRLKDITGTGHYRVFMRDGFAFDVAPDEATKLKAELLPKPEPLAAQLAKSKSGPPAAKRGPGRPPKNSKAKT